ncbi:Small nuclear RNA activating complex, polypeptide 1, 43kDa [Modicella reniformis]|uniref:Small nuclear RNA activating complex, polypeptide 1, 43kDa n=1 Tax=Modicella reniformis TaxID=1440133 RepID=A0A9P6SQZ4_9FUNG|nr:Small nuclear RNA activating complex, polypeptide 1, 43kDa [Modicella reniformis]
MSSFGPSFRDDRESSLATTRTGAPAALTGTRFEARQARSQRSIPSTTDCVILGRTGVYVRALHDDVQKLIRSYEEKQCIDFPTFSGIWEDQEFSLIHFGCGIAGEQFMGVLYERFLEYLSLDEGFAAQVGAIFGMYLLYFTQPTVSKKVPIRLTMLAWQNLEMLYQLGFEYDATDLIFIIHRLRERSAFIYVAENPSLTKELKQENQDLRDRTEKTLIRMEKKMNESFFVPYHNMLTDLKTIASHYFQTKADIASVSLAKRASEMVMARLVESKPPNLDLCGVKPIPTFLIPRPSDDEDDAMEPANETIATNGSTSDQDDETMDDESLLANKRPLPILEDSMASSQSITSPRDNSTITTEESSLPASVSVSAGLYGNQMRRRPDSGREVSESAPRIATVPLPSAFPQSMLQASTTIFPVYVEDISKRYYRNRMARQEFAAAGGLPQNDYGFPQMHMTVRRRRWTTNRKGNRDTAHRNTRQETDLNEPKKGPSTRSVKRRKKQRREAPETLLDPGQEEVDQYQVQSQGQEEGSRRNDRILQEDQDQVSEDHNQEEKPAQKEDQEEG